MRPPAPQESMTPKERVDADADGVLKEGFKPFVPASFTKSTVDASTFDPFPEYMPTEFSEKMLRYELLRNRKSHGTLFGHHVTYFVRLNSFFASGNT
jgi:hypothetical protein